MPITTLKLRWKSLIDGLRTRLGLDLPAQLENSLLRLQHARISARIPFLYLAIATVAFAASSGSGGPFSWLYHVALPGFFLTMRLVRGIIWYRRRDQQVSVGKLRKRLRNTVILTIIMGVVGSAWTMDAYYATIEARRVLAPIFLFMITFAGAISMLNLPRAAIGSIVAGLSWPTAIMIASDDISIRAMGLCFGIIAVMMICLVVHQFADTLSNLKMRAELRQLAETDALTGLANRRAFERKFVDLSRENGGEPSVDLVMIDLDGFKRANDDHGHAAGDAILKEVAQRLQQICLGAICISRFGGDEFALMLPPAGDEKYAGEQDDAIRTALGLPYMFDGSIVKVSASLGRAHSPKNGSDLSQLMKYADGQLYRDKFGDAQAGVRYSAA